MSKKRLTARHKHILNKITKRANKIAHYASLYARSSGEDYYSIIVARLNIFCLKHLINVVDNMDQDGTIDGTPLRDAAINELTQRKLFGKVITPFDSRQTRMLTRRRRWRFSW